MANYYEDDNLAKKNQVAGPPQFNTYKDANGTYRSTGMAGEPQQKQAVQPTAPTDVVSTSGKQPTWSQHVNAVKRYNDEVNPNGLRASLMPTTSLGYRPLRLDEKNAMQQQYSDIANMKGLSNRQRQGFLQTSRKQMAERGLRPTFDLESNDGISVRQQVANSLNRGMLDRGVIDQQHAMAEAANMHNYNLQKYRDDYQDMLWGRYWE
jgi:hypothetical protein